MANTTLSSIGGVLHDSRANEYIITGIADATVKPGDLCTVLKTGAVRQSDKSDSYDDTLGICLPSYHTDMDTAAASGKVIELVVPRAGHIYGCKMGDASTNEAGNPLIFDEAGAMAQGDGLETAHLARTLKTSNGDTYGTVIWVG